MQKYSTPAIVPGGGKDALAIETLPDVQFGSVDVYLASEVEAHIAEIEQQLAGANASIAMFMGPDGEQHIERFAAAIKSLMGTCSHD
jgi:hypothetical protein